MKPSLDLSLFYRFKNAVESLAKGKGDAKSRLEAINFDLLILRGANLVENGVSEELAKKWEEYLYSIKNPSLKEGKNEYIENENAMEINKLIFDIFCDLFKYHD